VVSIVAAAEEGGIRTPDQRLRVFVSSTLGELAAERAAVRAAIEALHLTPVMFELGARPHPPRDLYRAYLAQSHVFVGIYGQRYGWVAPGEEVSGIEDEYRLATGLPQLLYVKRTGERDPRLERLLDRVRADDRASYRHFTTPAEVAGLVQDDLVLLLSERFESSLAAPTHTGAGHRWTASAPPEPLTRTIGRDADIAAVSELVTADHARLVTITGPGGIGKSRLGIEVARRVADTFPDGTHLVPLAPVSDPAETLRAVADKLGVVGTAHRSIDDVLALELADRRMLLLLDNLEHLTEAGPAVAALLDRCPGLQVLSTSRRPLRIHGELEYPVSPLEVPVADDDTAARAAGVELFAERARAVRPDFALTPANLPAVAELVRRLDGLPLAIELAAARTRLLSPSALLARLEERLDILSDGALDLPERQRTLRATIEWSYRLLAPEEQRLLDRLSVFAGPATLEAVEAVCADPDDADVLEPLSSLLEKSLLQSTGADDVPRIQLLHTVRRYAAERHAERGGTATVADRHADWFLSRVRRVDFLQSVSAHTELDALVGEVDDIRRAMDRVLAQVDVPRTAAFAASTWAWFWLRGRLGDVRPWFEAAAARADHPGTDLRDRGLLLYGVGEVRQLMGDTVAAEEALLPALAAFQATGFELGVAGVQLALSAVQPDLGKLEEGYRRSLEALAIGERHGHPHLIGFAAAMIGSSRLVQGDVAGALAAHERSVEVARGCGFAILEAQALAQLAAVEAFAGRNVARAWDYLTDSAAVLRGSRNREILSYWLEFSAVALEARHPADALLATCAGDAVRDELQVTIWPLMRRFHDDFVARLRAEVGDEAPTIMAAAGRQDPWALMDSLLERHRRVTG
jgi:predicted ATPase